MFEKATEGDGLTPILPSPPLPPKKNLNSQHSCSMWTNQIQISFHKYEMESAMLQMTILQI